MTTESLEIDEFSLEPSERRGKISPTLENSSVQVGVLIGFRNDGAVPLVLVPGNTNQRALAARTTLDLHGKHIGRSVTLLFENGDPALPIVTGLLAQPASSVSHGEPLKVQIETDEDRLLLESPKQLVLRCGKASITLTRDGKVLIHGTYLSSRSTGVIRIKGGSVQLN